MHTMCGVRQPYQTTTYYLDSNPRSISDALRVHRLPLLRLHSERHQFFLGPTVIPRILRPEYTSQWNIFAISNKWHFPDRWCAWDVDAVRLDDSNDSKPALCANADCRAYWSDKFGRKGGMLVSALLIIVSGAVMAGSQDIATFLVFRFFAGAGAFMILAAVPIWMAEVVPPYLRGALVQLHAIVLVIGYMNASWLGYGIYFWKDGGSPDHVWRVPFAVQCFWPLCLCLGLWWVPESRTYSTVSPTCASILFSAEYPSSCIAHPRLL
jgi:hypothetical protein